MTDSKRRSVTVKCVKNEDVEKHINLIGIKSTRRSTPGNIAKQFVNDVQPLKTKKSDKIDKTKEKKNIQISDAITAERSELFEDVSDRGAAVLGTMMYGFKTPKRAKQMTKFAAESARKLCNLSKLSKKENQQQFEGKKKDAEEAESAVSKKSGTKVKFSVQEMNLPLENSDCTESSGSDDEEPSTKRNLATKYHSNDSESNKLANRINLPSETELYFEAHKSGKKLAESTSNRTLGKLKIAHMDRNKMQAILEEQQGKLDKSKARGSVNETSIIEKSRRKLIGDYTRYFRKWMFSMSNGFNVLLYGLGSKRKLVHSFCDNSLQDFTKVVVNGYFPSLTMKSILTTISDQILTEHSAGNNLEAQIDLICNHFSDGQEEDPEHIFLIIHNIDGVTLRNNKAQSILSQLASCSYIHIIATVDHINASLIWNQSKLCKYKWLWFDVTTYEPYTDETSYEDSLLLLTSVAGIGGSLALSGLLHVSRSLTPNARGIFKLLAEFQIEESKNASMIYAGFSFSDLYQQCREKFLVNSELTLRTQLTEFLDHKLVQIKKGLDGAEYLSIPLDNSTLQEYLEQATN